VSILKPVEKQRVAEEIVEQLRSLILTGQYPPGSKLPPERDLSKRLGVNRASLREALKKLEHLGLVRIRQGDGTRVTNFMETGGIELVQHLLPLAGRNHPELIRDMLELRRIFGREIARLAAHRSTPDAMVRLRALADKADASATPTELFETDFEFYVALTQVASYMPLLANLTASPESVRAHHRALIDAVAAKDAERAGKVADDHLRSGAELAARMGGRAELSPLPLPAA
jgi:GntR family transcriptional repressor for pyruvate dehydrogenase complex